MRIRRRTGAVAAVLIATVGLAACSRSEAPQPSQTSSSSATSQIKVSQVGLNYTDDGSDEHKLDVFLPGDGTAGPYPLVIFIHGGGWRTGDKETWSQGSDMKVEQLKAKLMDAGYATASINYQLFNPDASYEDGKAFPQNIFDTKAAVRYLRANATELRLDPNRFAVLGESAGAHLAQLLATSGGVADLEGDLGNAGVSSAVQAAISFYGFNDLAKRSDQLRAAGCTEETSRDFTSEGRMLGAEPNTPEGAELAKKASSITYLDAGDPPMLLEHGTQDCTAPVEQSKNMDEAMKKLGIPVELKLFDVGHANEIFYASSDSQDAVLGFLEAQLP